MNNGRVVTERMLRQTMQADSSLENTGRAGP